MGGASFCSSFSVNNMTLGSDPSDVNEEDKPSKNLIAHISQFADDNLTFVRASNRFKQCVSFDFILIWCRKIQLPEMKYLVCELQTVGCAECLCKTQ